MYILLSILKNVNYITNNNIKKDKMKEDNGTIFIILVFSIGLIVFGFVIGKIITINDSETHETIVKHNCGEYNPKTGVFQFVK